MLPKWVVAKASPSLGANGTSGLLRNSRATNAALSAALAILCNPGEAFAAPDYVTGKIISLTTTTEGVMIILDSGVPTNCVNPYLNWMLIPTGYGAMASLVLSMWLRGDARVTVYTTPTTNNYCAVNQVAPVIP